MTATLASASAAGSERTGAIEVAQFVLDERPEGALDKAEGIDSSRWSVRRSWGIKLAVAGQDLAELMERRAVSREGKQTVGIPRFERKLQLIADHRRGAARR